jgi:hypothetical protein
MAKKKISDKPLSIRELKAWLEGIDDIQGGREKWTPDQNQWKRIREKIDQLPDESFVSGDIRVEGTTAQPVQRQHRVDPPQQQMWSHPPQVQNLPPPGPSSLEESAATKPKSVKSGIKLQAVGNDGTIQVKFGQEGDPGGAFE